MDSKCGRTAMKQPRWKGFGVGRSTFSCYDSRDTERDCPIRAILPYRNRNRNYDRNRILNPWLRALTLIPLWIYLPSYRRIITGEKFMKYISTQLFLLKKKICMVSEKTHIQYMNDALIRIDLQRRYSNTITDYSLQSPLYDQHDVNS